MRRLFVLVAASLLSAAVSSTASAVVNLAVNPSFAGNLTGWNPNLSTYDSVLNAPAVPGSGSAQNIFNAVGPSTIVAIDQCVTVVSGKSYAFGGSVFIPTAQAVGGTGFVTVSWFSGTDCTTGFISFASQSSSTTGSWVPLTSGSIVAPPGAQRAWLTGQNAATAAGAHQVNFDDMFLNDLAANATALPVPVWSNFGLAMAILSLGAIAALALRRSRLS